MYRVKSWLKKFFIPHLGNEHKPYFLRLEATVFILSGILVVELLFLAAVTIVFPHSSFFAALLNSVLISETNENRTDHFLQPLQTNLLLNAAAQLKAEDMATKGYFAHVSPEGITPWHWMDLVGYRYTYAGENLAINFFDSKDAMDAWMNSVSHRENILDAHFTEVGIGIAQGQYEGKSTFFVVQMFGRPVSSKTKVVAGVPVVSNTTSSVTSSLQNNPQQIVLSATTGGEQVKEQNGFQGFVGKIATSPRTLTNVFFIILMTIIAIALALKIGIAYKIQYPKPILNGILMLVIIASALLLNQYLVFSQMKLF